MNINPASTGRYITCKKHIVCSPFVICLTILGFAIGVISCKTKRIKNGRTYTHKQLYIPGKTWMVPEGNDFNNDEHEFSYKRMVTSENIAIFWAKAFGPDTSKNPDTTARLDMHAVLKECDRFYKFYIDTMGFVKKGSSVTDRNKLLIFVFKGKENTAFGGGEAKVGIA